MNYPDYDDFCTHQMDLIHYQSGDEATALDDDPESYVFNHMDGDAT